MGFQLNLAAYTVERWKRFC